ASRAAKLSGQHNRIPHENGWLLSGFFDDMSVEYGDSTAPLNQPLATSHQPLALAISPNPFNPTTAISFQLSAFSLVNLSVYDIQGRLVDTLVDGFRVAGYHQVTFDGSDVSSGVYVYRLTLSSTETRQHSLTGKMVLMK
ncbi:T9SS type A sorting domain-containing protein, partial [bacterium]|nr:T9SS type A sorting domain-containing protein [bacterium]